MGFVRQGSRASLVAGVGLGLSFGAAGWLMKDNQNGGLELALGTSLLLSGAMIPRALRTRKRILLFATDSVAVPIGMGAIGCLTLLYYSKKYFEQINGV